MKILFLSTMSPDYLQDCLLIGLREILGDNLIDYPKKECMYKGYQEAEKLYGRGFTIYTLLEDIDIYRENIIERIKQDEFDFIIFSSIHRQIKLIQDLFHLVKNKNVVFVDGEDHPSIFPFNGGYWRRPKYWFLPRVHKKYLYFKREYTPETIFYRFYKLIPQILCKRLVLRNIKSISFAFPTAKIIASRPVKEKLFPEHIVDSEVAEKLMKKIKYVFDNEQDYFNDIQKSKYGISTKRSGWDCMRHYEIAANGTVICFKDLEKKPETSAPHGLNNSNCITYSNYNDLMHKVNTISETDYDIFQQNSLEWAKKNSTESRAKEFIKEIETYFNRI